MREDGILRQLKKKKGEILYEKDWQIIRSCLSAER